MAQVTDDFGNLFRRGVPTPLNIHDWQMLSSQASRVQGAAPVDHEHLADFTALAARVEDRCRQLHAEFMSARPTLTGLVEEIALRANPLGATSRHK